jgi:undecaprenyl-diphosphatase
MSDLIEAILLGIIQGLTEFLPVSSSGHLELAKVMFGYDKSAEESMLLTVILHAATALSTMVIFRKEIIEIITGLVSFDKEQVDFSGKIILSMIPAAIVGVLFDDHLEALFDRQILLVGLMLVLTGALLFLADQAKNTSKRVSWGNAFIIGIAQMVAILPGISRSGATISTSVSFRMVVPLILGKMAKDILSGEITYAEGELIPLAAGFVAAFVTGLLACTWMIALVKKSKLSYFAYYCFMVAAFAIAKGLGWF